MKAIPNFKSFISIFLVLIGLNLSLFSVLPEVYQQNEIVYAHLMFFILAVLLDFILNRVQKIDETLIGKTFLAFSTFKIIGGLLFLLPWILNKDETSYPYIIQFFIIYFFYLAAEAMIFIKSYLSK
jgi:hypothetical protein